MLVLTAIKTMQTLSSQTSLRRQFPPPYDCMIMPWIPLYEGYNLSSTVRLLFTETLVGARLHASSLVFKSLPSLLLQFVAIIVNLRMSYLFDLSRPCLRSVSYHLAGFYVLPALIRLGVCQPLPLGRLRAGVARIDEIWALDRILHCRCKLSLRIVQAVLRPSGQ